MTKAVTLVGAPEVRPKVFGHRDFGFVASEGMGVEGKRWEGWALLRVVGRVWRFEVV
jgi:hypothetical protein